MLPLARAFDANVFIDGHGRPYVHVIWKFLGGEWGIMKKQVHKTRRKREEY